MADLYLIAGHGDGDPGACANGYAEADLVRRLCERIKALGGDAVAYLDPSKDWYRAGGISTYPFPSGAQVIECHLDSASASARGGHVIVKAGGGTDSYDEALASAVAAMFPGRSSKIVERGDLANVNRAAARGDISYRLCEFCFISNPDDVAKFVGDLDTVARMVLGAFGIEAAREAGGEWRQGGDGRWWYRHADGSYASDGWEMVGGRWYLFDADGWMLTGWRKVGGKWYCMADSGAMMADTWVPGSDGRWSWLTSDGSAATGGWCEVRGRWAYFDADGYAAMNECVKINGHWFAFGSDCYMVEGAVPLDDSGAMVL